jgi:hypothetical protein
VRSLYERIEKAIEDRGLGWVPALRPGYFGFQRPGGYHCARVDIYRRTPGHFWIKLPLAPDELCAPPNTSGRHIHHGVVKLLSI